MYYFGISKETPEIVFRLYRMRKNVGIRSSTRVSEEDIFVTSADAGLQILNSACIQRTIVVFWKSLTPLYLLIVSPRCCWMLYPKISILRNRICSGMRLFLRDSKRGSCEHSVIHLATDVILQFLNTIAIWPESFYSMSPSFFITTF